MGKRNIRVFLADDHAMFANALALTLQGFQNIAQVKAFSNGKELLDSIAANPPDVVITDLEMPVLDGLEVIKKLNRMHPEIKVILLTMYDDLQIVKHALDLGAHAFLTKSFDPKELNEAIESVVLRDFYHNELMYRALKTPSFDKPQSPPENVSAREKEVLLYICDELTMKEIGEKMILSEKTIQNHRAALLRKLNARNTAGLVKKAIEFGWYRLQ